MKNFNLLVLSTLSLSACNYSNTFNGTFNGAPASMTAYSKNINKYCVALSIHAGSDIKDAFISAQSVFDTNDFLSPMSFNTKGAECGVNLDEYLVGTRNTHVMNISYVTERVQMGGNYCKTTTYKSYQYKEEINFEMKKNTTDETTGSFNGIGQVAQYIDRDHPVNDGPIYFCGIYYPSPRPFPHYGSNYGSTINIHFGPRR